MSGAKMVTRLFAGTFVSLAIGVLAGAGVASADQDDYIKDLDTSHIVGPRVQLLQLGYQACTDKNAGVKRADAIQKIVKQSQQDGNKGLDDQQADFLYGSALRNLCAS
jgi:hypothetical protein